MSTARPPSLVLVGAGLQNGLIALAALQAEPEARVVLLERDAEPCGNHTWSFHAADVPPRLQSLVHDITSHRWSGYEVRFAEHERQLGLGYASIDSRDLARILRQRLAEAPNAELRTSTSVEHIGARHVSLADGSVVEGDLVVDARGPRIEPGSRCGFQKFYGVELSLDHPHGLERPLLMDATVEQIDGFRFLYVLPLGPTRLLVEDTVFSTSAELTPARWRDRVLEEAEARGWSSQNVVREELGVLPMPWKAPGPKRQSRGPLRAGYRGHWFHPATGYSTPQALRVAALVAGHVHAPDLLFQADDYRALVRSERRQARFARFLNRLLFTGVSPDTRWTVFQRFYGHPESVISRFYAGAMTRTDRARMLVGRPPRGFSIRSALMGSALR